MDLSIQKYFIESEWTNELAETCQVAYQIRYLRSCLKEEARFLGKLTKGNDAQGCKTKAIKADAFKRYPGCEFFLTIPRLLFSFPIIPCSGKQSLGHISELL